MVKGLFEIDKFYKTGLKGGKIGGKGGMKENFHLGAFAVKKVKKVGLLRMGGCAAELPG